MCVHMLDVLGGESATVQVRTSNSWMRGEDEKNIKGIRRTNLNGSALLRHTHPPARLLSDKSKTHSAPPASLSLALSVCAFALEYMQTAKTLRIELQEWIIVGLIL